jgi:hypothetical protein
MKRKKKQSPVLEKLEILRSVFDPPVPAKPLLKGTVRASFLESVQARNLLNVDQDPKP